MSIEIKRVKGGDTRSCEKDISKEELLESTEQHIDDVRKAIMWMIMELFMSSSKHDYTKVRLIDEFYNDFSYAVKNKTDFIIQRGIWGILLFEGIFYTDSLFYFEK